MNRLIGYRELETEKRGLSVRAEKTPGNDNATIIISRLLVVEFIKT